MPYSGLAGFSYPFFFGLISILFSFGKGLLFFTPGLLLPIRTILKKHQQESKINLYQVYLYWISFLIGVILMYSRWWAWWGGLFWGPRFFLIAALPATLAIAVRLRYRKDLSLLSNFFTLGILCLSVWVAIDGALFQWVDGLAVPHVCSAAGYSYEMLCYYTPEFSPLWYPFVKHLPITPAQLLFASYFIIVALYLAFPLLLQIGYQAKAAITKYTPVYLSPKNWRI